MLFYLFLYFNIIKKYNEENDEGYCLEVDVHYLEKLHKVNNDLPFLLEESLQSQKRWKKGENIETLDLPQYKVEENIWCLNQIIILRSYSQLFY